MTCSKSIRIAATRLVLALVALTTLAQGASRDYNPSPGLEKIQAALLAINSADDERNPPETGLMEREMKRVKNGRYLLIPSSESTAGHGTTAQAKFWKSQLVELLQSAPRR